MRHTKIQPELTITEILGWYGVLAVVAAYMLVSLDRISPDAHLYQFLNITGSLALMGHSYVKRDLQPLLLNLVWLAIAVIALLGIA